MNPSEPIEGFLQAQEAEGQRDSQGQFTISAEEAWRKLGRSQLPPLPEAWILPIVQAANRAGCSRMEVRLGRRVARITLRGTWSWSLPELEHALFWNVAPDTALHSLATALRALLTGPRAGSLALRTPTGENLHWDGERLVVSAAPLSPGEETVLEVAHVASGGGLFGLRPTGAAAVAAGIQSTLASEAVASSVPIWCDGRLITGLEKTMERPDRRILAYLPAWDRDLPTFGFPVPARWRPGSWKDQTSFVLTSAQPSADSGVASAVAVLSVAVSGKEGASGPLELVQSHRSCLVWVRDGVVVGHKALPMRGSLDLRIFASAQGLPTDLSDLSLRQGRELLQRQRSVGSVVSGVLQQLRDEGEGNAFQVQGRVGKLLPALAAGVVITSLFNPLQALGLAGLGSFAALHWRNLHHETNAQMDLKLERELNILPRALRTALDTSE